MEEREICTFRLESVDIQKRTRILCMAATNVSGDKIPSGIDLMWAEAICVRPESCNKCKPGKIRTNNHSMSVSSSH